MAIDGATSRSLNEILAAWPEPSRRVAAITVERYGYPDEIALEQLGWNERAPWKRIIANRNGVPHLFPRPHEDLLEHWILYRVWPERRGDLARFERSLIVAGAGTELGVRCDREEMCCLTLNLAHEVITGRRDVHDARRTYTEKVLGLLSGKVDPYTTALQFVVEV